MWLKDPDPGDPKRPNPTGSGSATLVLRYVVNNTMGVGGESVRKSVPYPNEYCLFTLYPNIVGYLELHTQFELTIL